MKGPYISLTLIKVQMNLDLELPDNSVILTEVPAASVHKEDAVA